MNEQEVPSSVVIPSEKNMQAFRDNPVISQLAHEPRWTISGTIGPIDDENNRGKAPIDIRLLAASDCRIIKGAKTRDQASLMELDEVNNLLPNAANNAFFIQAIMDGYIVVDIEKTCPPDIAAELLSLPNLYSEVSMSGRGYHMIIPLPKNFDEYPIAANKVVLQSENGWYEMLMEHFVTFTRVPIPPDRIKELNAAPRTSSETAPARSWEEVYASLAQRAIEKSKKSFETNIEPPEIPMKKTIMSMLERVEVGKTLADFGNDNSRWEFYLLGQIYNRLQMVTQTTVIKNVCKEYDANQKSWLIYEALVKQIPHRPKHDERRDKLPLLLKSASDLVAYRMAESEE